ncbi:hypothetical protein FRB99_007591 [Tulasnella sp. 403]|nr:hypothetical protein FRB99_007591 [Tulasnella sp. 403]
MPSVARIPSPICFPPSHPVRPPSSLCASPPPAHLARSSVHDDGHSVCDTTRLSPGLTCDRSPSKSFPPDPRSSTRFFLARLPNLASASPSVDEGNPSESTPDTSSHRSMQASNSPTTSPPPAQGTATPATHDASNMQYPQQHQPLHSQQQSHLNSTQQHLSFQLQQNVQFERSSYLDALSDSSSVPFLTTPHSDSFNSSVVRDQQKSYSLGPDDNIQYRGASVFNSVRPRPSQNPVSSFDDITTPFPNGDMFPSQQHQQHPGQLPLDRFDGDKNAFANVLRNNSVAANGGPYGTGSTLPESQQVIVNKAMQHQAQQALQQQQLQAQQLAASNVAAQTLLNIPGNLSSRDYFLALQNAHTLAQMGAQVPGLLANNPNLVSNLQGIGLSNIAGNAAPPTNQEEISTIFVVGFPDDMQEREFQNMFTFCPGFEAATLKVPNKELPSYGANGNSTAAQAAAALRSAGIFPSGQGFSNPSNDPYNLLTTNSGGVVLDSRDLSSANVANIWNGLANGASSTDDTYRALNLPPGADLSVLAPPAPRKQIIGFAKFRTRQEALDAREVLQGRRVDMEKGSILKAEMAKKNLHTKRGVGPVSNSSNQTNTNNLSAVLNAETLLAGITAQQLSQVGGLASLAALHQQATQQNLSLGGDAMTQRDRESAALAAMGLNGVASTRDRDREREKERDRERELEHQARARLGSVNLNSYDAFYSVPGSTSLPARPTAYPSLPNNGSASLPPGITPAGPISGQSNHATNNFDLGAPGSRVVAGYNASGGLLNGNGSHPLSSQSSLSSVNGHQDSNGVWPSSFGTSVDPLDTSGAMGPGPSAAVGGPTSASGLQLPIAGTLSRKPSSLNNASSPEQSSTFPATVSPVNGGSQILDRSQHQSPAIPQGQPSSMSPPLSQTPTQSQTMYSVNGSSIGRGHPTSSSRGSAGSASPPENYQASFGSLPNTNQPSSMSQGFYDDELSRGMAGLQVGTHQDMTSPQLPSPGSGRGNAADQNPPVSFGRCYVLADADSKKINTLYVGNLPSNNQAHPNTLEDNLRVLFSRCPGYRKLCFRQKNNGPMCFVEFDDVSYASKALNDLYGHTLNGLVKGGIRLSFSKNPLGVRTSSVSTAPNSLATNANLFNAALAGSQDGSRFGQNHLLPTRHASLSAANYAADAPPPRNARQESIDVLSPSSFSSFGFNHRSFSPPSMYAQQNQPPPRGISQTSFSQPPQLTSHSHQSLIDGLAHFNGFDPRDQHVLSTPHANPISSSPQPGVEA